jgi:hypothetical protein
MNPGNGVPDADLSCRPGQHDASTTDSGPDAGASHDGSLPTRSLRVQRPLQDIQDIIDKLAAVTQQLRRPGSSLPGSSR